MRRSARASHHDLPLVTLDITETVATLRPASGKVLLLEDRDDFREVIHEHLAFRHYAVTSVRSGVEGLSEIMKGSFDIILCDMLMPKVGGEMFYWAVARVRPAAVQRFIFFTGHRNNPSIDFFFKRVNATVLIKPFKLGELDTAMQGVLLKLR